MSNKMMRISISKYPDGKQFVDGEYESALLEADEYPYLYLDRIVTDDELDDALKIITTHCMQRRIHTISIEMDIKNKIEEEKVKPLTLTMEQLEHMLGRKVEIVASDILSSKDDSSGFVVEQNKNPIYREFNNGRGNNEK